MSRLIAIRHAQASFMKADYDQLSDLGYRQARKLGDYLAGAGYSFDVVYVGPLKRHWQTLQMVQEAYQAKGLVLPEPVQIDELAEHQGMEIMQEVLPLMILQNERMKKWAAAAEADPSQKRKNRLRIFTLFMELWAKGTLDIEHPAHYQTWANFRETVTRGIEKIIDQEQKGQTVAAFTSGGTIAASLGYALEMAKEERIVELNGQVKNTSMTEFLFSKNKITLKTFNEIPHLIEQELITYV